MTAVIACDHPSVLTLHGQLEHAIKEARGKKNPTHHDRTRWSQLISRANKLIAQLSKNAKELIVSMVKTLSAALKQMQPSRNDRARKIRAHPCAAH